MRLLSFAVLAIAVAACADAPTREEFVARADEICADHNARFDDMTADAMAQGGLRGAAYREWLEDYVDEYEAMKDELANLDRPEGDAAIERYLDRLRRNADGLREGLDEDTLTSERFLSAANNSLHAAWDRAEDVGLKECSALD